MSRGGTLNRESMNAFSADVMRLMDDPTFVKLWDMIENEIIELITDPQNKNDGSPEFDNFERELCRQLRTMKSLKRIMMAVSAGGSLREATANDEPGSGTTSRA